MALAYDDGTSRLMFLLPIADTIRARVYRCVD